MPDSPVRPFARSPVRLVVGLAASGAVGALAYRRGSLSGGGVAGAMLVGPTIFAGGGLAPSALPLAYRRGPLRRGGVARALLAGTPIFAGGGLPPSALLLASFTSSGALSRGRKGRQRESEVEHAKGERRDFAQVIANGGVAAALV